MKSPTKGRRKESQARFLSAFAFATHEYDFAVFANTPKAIAASIAATTVECERSHKARVTLTSSYHATFVR